MKKAVVLIGLLSLVMSGLIVAGCGDSSSAGGDPPKNLPDPKLDPKAGKASTQQAGGTQSQSAK